MIAARRIQRVDVGRVNDRIFVNNCSLGVYPSIVEARERFRERGHSKWTAFVMATVEVLRRDDELSVRLDADRHENRRTHAVRVCRQQRISRRGHQAGRACPSRWAPAALRISRRRCAHDTFRICSPTRCSDCARREHVLSSVAAVELWIDTPSHIEYRASRATAS